MILNAQIVSDVLFRFQRKLEQLISLLEVGSGGVKLYFAGNEKLTTTINGIEVPDLNVTGVGTVGRLDTSGVTSEQMHLHLLQNLLITQEQYLVVQLMEILVFTMTPIIHIFKEYWNLCGTGDIYMMLGGDNAIIAKTDNSVELYWDDANLMVQNDNANVENNRSLHRNVI